MAQKKKKYQNEPGKKNSELPKRKVSEKKKEAKNKKINY